MKQGVHSPSTHVQVQKCVSTITTSRLGNRADPWVPLASQCSQTHACQAQGETLSRNGVERDGGRRSVSASDLHVHTHRHTHIVHTHWKTDDTRGGGSGISSPTREHSTVVRASSNGDRATPVWNQTQPEWCRRHLPACCVLVSRQNLAFYEALTFSFLFRFWPDILTRVGQSSC